MVDHMEALKESWKESISKMNEADEIFTCFCGSIGHKYRTIENDITDGKLEIGDSTVKEILNTNSILFDAYKDIQELFMMRKKLDSSLQTIFDDSKEKFSHFDLDIEIIKQAISSLAVYGKDVEYMAKLEGGSVLFILVNVMTMLAPDNAVLKSLLKRIETGLSSDS